MEALLYLIIGITIGLVIGYIACSLMSRGKTAIMQAKAEALNDENQRLREDFEHQKAEIRHQYEGQMSELKTYFDTQREHNQRLYEKDIDTLKAHQKQQMADLESTHSRLNAAQEQRHKETVEALQNRFEETVAKMTARMQHATEDMLKQRQQEFANSSQSHIGQIVDPLRQTISDMKRALDESRQQQTAMSSQMRTNIEQMMHCSEEARKSTDELARVFRHGVKVQGVWGETVLDELLQAQGLTPGIHYDLQATIRDEDGKALQTADGSMLRPDVILHIDTERELIIDAKVSLAAYMDFVNAEDEDTRQHALKAHVESIRNQVRLLSAKDYSAYIKKGKVRMDYVIMFMPHSGALWTALNVQPDLWRKAMEKNVFIADEQTLFAALRIIQLTWAQIQQAQNQEKLFAHANEIVERVGMFYNRYQTLGKALGQAKKAYESANLKLLPQGQSILRSANELVRLGARQSARYPLPAESEERLIEAEATEEEDSQ